MGSSTGGATANDSMAELFGLPGRRPLLSNTLRTLSGIFSHFPDENPFAQMVGFNFTPAVWEAINAAPRKSRLTSDGGGNDPMTRGEKEPSVELGHPASGVVENLRTYNNEKRVVETVEVLCKNNGVNVNVSDMIIDDMNAGRNSETVDKDASQENTDNKTSEAHNVTQGLLGIERMLMDESDVGGLLEMSDQDVNFDIFKDLGSFTATDGFGDNPVPVENNGNDKSPVEGILKQDVVVENKGKRVEVANSTSGGNEGQCHAFVPTDREKSGSSEVGNLSVDVSPKDVERKMRKVSQNEAKIGVLNERGDISGGKSVDSTKKGHKSVKSRVMEKDKTKNKKKAKEDVKLRKRKHESVDSGGSNTKKSRGSNSVGNGKALEENVQVNEENLSVKSAGKLNFTKGERLQYTREQLMHLRPQATVPEDIVKVVKEISVQLLGGGESATVEEVTASGILKKKKRGTSSEAKKEKKKAKKRKKRAEQNKKLGVKRLKLRPVLKPKVVRPCRHFLYGRCQEGEKCKFSHDVVPLTKSKPCCHFAKQTCMKGDDCPFDHELSKYPCNNIVETGFCSRGDRCLFSHKIPAKQATETTASVSKSQTYPLNQPDKSKSTQWLIPTASHSGITATKNQKENLAAQIGRPSKTLKGVSFLSFGKSPPDNSGKQLGGITVTPTSQPNVDIARTSGQLPNLAVSLSSDIPLTSLPSPTPQRYSFDGSRAQNLAGAIGLRKSFMIYPASPTPESTFPSLERSSADRVVLNSQANVDGAGTSGQSNQTVSGTTVTPQVASFVSLEKTLGDSFGKKDQASSSPNTPFVKPLLHDSASKGQVDSASGQKLQGHSAFSLTENRGGNVSDKFEAVDSDGPVSSSTLGQSSIQATRPVNSTPDTAKRAILSTLAFAARYESKIKMSLGAAKKNEGASASGSQQKEPTIKASDLLERLYGGSRKENQ